MVSYTRTLKCTLSTYDFEGLLHAKAPKGTNILKNKAKLEFNFIYNRNARLLHGSVVFFCKTKKICIPS